MKEEETSAGGTHPILINTSTRFEVKTQKRLLLGQSRSHAGG